MSYRIVKFGTLDLPELDPEDDLSTHEANNPLVRTLGGWFDTAGSGAAGVQPLQLRVQRRLISDDAPGPVYAPEITQDAYVALRALIDTRAALWREWPDGTLEWADARLLQISSRADRKDNRNLVDLEFAFIVESPCWYGASDGTLEVGGGTTYYNYVFLTPDDYTVGGIVNGGNATASNLTIIVDPTTPAITALRIRNLTTGHDLTFGGTIAAGKMLVIDCGAKQIRNDGVAAYNDLTEPTTAKWFELVPGSNTIGVDITGGAYTSGVFFVFYPPWR